MIFSAPVTVILNDITVDHSCGNFRNQLNEIVLIAFRMLNIVLDLYFIIPSILKISFNWKY